MAEKYTKKTVPTHIPASANPSNKAWGAWQGEKTGFKPTGHDHAAEARKLGNSNK
jgi:hypothetical protein